jgi:hypothetical protein
MHRCCCASMQCPKSHLGNILFQLGLPTVLVASLILRGEYTFIRSQKRYVSALALLIPHRQGIHEGLRHSEVGHSCLVIHLTPSPSQAVCYTCHWVDTSILVLCLNHKPQIRSLSSTFRCFRFLPSLTLRATLSDIDIDSCPSTGEALSEDSEVLRAKTLQPQPVGLRSQNGACLSSFVYFYERKAKVQIVHHAPVSSRAPGDREFINRFITCDSHR